MVAPWPGWAAPEYLGYGDDTGYGDTSAAQGDENGAYDAQNQEPDQPEFRQPYQPASAPASESAVTLIYKDGRPREQIHNYILTRTKLFVQDEPHRTIPVEQLDLAATGMINREAGVVFQLPSHAM